MVSPTSPQNEKPTAMLHLLSLAAPPVLESKFCSNVVQWHIRNQSSIDPNIPPPPYTAGHTFRLCLDTDGVRFSQKGYSVNPSTQQPQFIWQI